MSILNAVLDEVSDFLDSKKKMCNLCGGKGHLNRLPSDIDPPCPRCRGTAIEPDHPTHIGNC